MNWLLLIPLFLSWQTARPQTQPGTGTILFMVYSTDNFTVAADSRMTMLLPGEFDDKDCKISAFGDKFVFTMAGVAFKDERDPRLIAREVWQKESVRISEPKSLVHAVAREWIYRMVPIYKSLDQKEIKAIRKMSGWESFATADIVATDGNGRLAAVTASMRFDGDLFDKTGQVKIVTDVKDLESRKWYSAGKHEIADEYVTQSSERAKEYMAQFARGLAGLSPREIDVAVAADMVKVSIRLQADSYFAPPVDVLQLNKTTGVKWISVKPNCPRN